MMKPFHPIAETFPLMLDAEREALVADIKANGLREPIDLFEDRILDGRNRATACEKLGVSPSYRTFNGNAKAAVDYVVSKNLHRRHLNESQRAMVASKIATLRQGHKPNSSIELSQGEAAASMNISVASVKRATVVRDNGSPELQRKVEDGAVSVSAAAKVAKRKGETKRKTGRASYWSKPKHRKRPTKDTTAEPKPAPSQHDSDLRFLREIWQGACSSARVEFLRGLGFDWKDVA